MGKEIERKFLVRHDGWMESVEKSFKITQGYLCFGPPASVRIRIKDEKANLNIKQSIVDIERSEFEYSIPLEEAKELMGLCAGVIIEKTRHEVFFEKMKWEIDVFEGKNQGLVLAEVEMDTKETEIGIPEWAGNEVSGDIRFFNTYLAQNPYVNWNK